MKDIILASEPYYHSMRECMAMDYIRVKDCKVTTRKCKSKPVKVIDEMGKRAKVIECVPHKLLYKYTEEGFCYDNIITVEKSGHLVFDRIAE